MSEAPVDVLVISEDLTPILITLVLAGMFFRSTLTGAGGAYFPVDGAVRVFDKIWC